MCDCGLSWLTTESSGALLERDAESGTYRQVARLSAFCLMVFLLLCMLFPLGRLRFPVVCQDVRHEWPLLPIVCQNESQSRDPRIPTVAKQVNVAAGCRLFLRPRDIRDPSAWQRVSLKSLFCYSDITDSFVGKSMLLALLVKLFSFNSRCYRCRTFWYIHGRLCPAVRIKSYDLN
jgi:hypothetical protein